MSTLPTTTDHRSAVSRVPWLPLVLLACGALALAGGLLHRHVLSLAAAVLLLLAWLPAVWRRRSAVALLVWLALAALLVVPALLGHAELALMALPVVFLAAVSWTFASTLRRGEEPLVQRCVRVIEGEARVALPGVRAYTRGVTVYWTVLLGVLALVALALALLARPGGWLETLGVAAPVALPGAWLAWYPEAGCWAILLTAFVAEYLFRRWYLRGIPHPSARRFVSQIARRWPELVRGSGR